MNRNEQFSEIIFGMTSRRDFLKRSILVAAVVPVGASLLAACGGDDDDDAPEDSGDAGDQESTAGESEGDAAEPTEEDDSSSGEGQSGGQIALGINLEPDNLDPAVTPFAVSHTVMMNIYDPLVWRSVDGDFVPGLATAWEIADDGLTYTFTLRDDVTFHDDTPFNAEAVQKFLDRVIDPATQSGFAANLIGPYDSANVVDDYSVEVILSAPFAPLLDGLSQAFLGIPSPTAQEADPEGFLRNPVGTGFMKFSEWVEADHITLIKNEDYNWAPSIFNHSGPAYLDELTIRFFPDNPTRLAALEAGDVHVIEQLPDSDLSRMEGDDNYSVSKATSPGVPSILQMSTTRPPTDDLAVRQAVISAIDQETIVDVAMFGATDPAFGPLWENTPSYSADVESFYAFDADSAAQMLEDAGWTGGSGDIREKDGQTLTIDWAITESNDPYAELVQAQVREVGIEIVLQRMDTAASFEAIRNDEVNMRSIGWISSDPVILTNLYHSKNIEEGFGWTKYNDPRLDEVLDEGEQATDPAERDEFYGEAQQIIMENALCAPLFGIPRNMAIQQRYKDMGRDFRTYPWFYDTYIEE